MKIALLSGDIINRFAAAIILKLKQQGYDVSTVVVRKNTNYINRIKLFIARKGARGIILKAKNKLFLEQNIEKKNANSYLSEYFIKLNHEPNTTLKKVIEENGIPLMFVENILEDRCLEHLRSIEPDVIIYAGGGILRKKLLEIPIIGVLNAHMAFLPEYKGMNVLEWSIFNDDSIGVTIHFIDEGIDTGDILLKKVISIEPGDTIQSLREKSLPLSADAFAEVVEGLKNETIRPTEQENKGKQYFVMHKRLKDIIDARLQTDHFLKAAV